MLVLHEWFAEQILFSLVWVRLQAAGWNKQDKHKKYIRSYGSDHFSVGCNDRYLCSI